MFGKKKTESADTQATKGGKVLSGTVMSDKMDKTIVVAVNRYVKHPKYGKFMRIRKKYKVHDPHNAHHVGEAVRIRETKRFSKDKAFEVLEEERS